MKKILMIVAIMLIFATYGYSQIQWEENGIPIRHGKNIRFDGSSAILPDGSVVYLWSDTRVEDRDIWAQRIDNEGNLLWGNYGVLVIGHLNDQHNPAVTATEDGGVIVAWEDLRGETWCSDIYAQKLNENGLREWDEFGVLLCLAEENQYSLSIVTDGSNGAYVVWDDQRNSGGSDIYGSHITSSGEIAEGWAENGNPIAAESDVQSNHTLVSDGIGGAVIFWDDERNSDDKDIYGQRIIGDGTLVWHIGGTPICVETNNQYEPKATRNENGDFVVCWRDKRNDSGDIYAQKLTVIGNFLWDEEVEVIVHNGTQRHQQIAPGSDDGVFIVWSDNRFCQHEEIFAQKINSNGNLMWEAEGLPISIEENNQNNPKLVNDAESGCFFIWKDGRENGYSQEDIAMQHVNGNGDILWEENGKIICNSNGEQSSPNVCFDGSNRVYSVWKDDRCSPREIDIQILDGSGNIYLEPNGKQIYSGIGGNAINHQLAKIDDNNFLISWMDTRNGYENEQIYMQILQANGNQLFEPNGIPITEETGYEQFDFQSAISPQNNVNYFVWLENRSGYKHVYTQAVDMLGNQLFDSQGLQVCDIFCQQEHPYLSVMTENNQDNLYIGWTDYRDFTNSSIVAQKIVNGEIQWDSEGLEIANPSHGDVLTDVVDRFFIWQNEDWPEIDIYMKLIDEDGNTAPGWIDDGLCVCGADGKQTNAKGILVPDGLLVMWEDVRNASTYDRDIYAQLIDYEGNVLWEADGIPIANFINDQTRFSFIYDENIYVSWQDFRNGENIKVYMQKLDLEGNCLWNPEGVPIADSDHTQMNPRIQKTGEYITAVWDEAINYEYSSNIYSQKITTDGQIVWDEPMVICNSNLHQSYPLLETSSNNAIIIWKDCRSSKEIEIDDIYAQKIKVYENSTEENPSVNNFNLHQNFPNPFYESTTISFITNREDAKNAEINIYNIKGQLIRTIKPENTNRPDDEPFFKVRWDGKDENGNQVASGIYFYKLFSEKDKFSEVKKAILLR